MRLANVAVLAFPLTYEVWGGISWATYRTVEAMTELYPKDQFTLLLYEPKIFHKKVWDLIDARENLTPVLVEGKRAAIRWAKEKGVTVWGPEHGVLPTRDIPQVVTVHDMRQFTQYRDHGIAITAHRIGLKRAFRHARATVAISPSTFNDLVPYVKRHNLHHIPWGVPQGFVDGDAIKPERPPVGDPDSPFILTMYDPFPHKRMDLLEEVGPLLEVHDWDFMVVGSLRGEAPPVEHHRIHYLGFVEENDLTAYMKAAALLLHPSEYEGFGHPPYEAMALGVPVLYNRQCKALDTAIGKVANGFQEGHLVPILDHLMADEVLRRQHVDEAREWVRAWDWATTAALYVDLFRRLSPNYQDVIK